MVEDYDDILGANPIVAFRLITDKEIQIRVTMITISDLLFQSFKGDENGRENR